MRVLITIAGLVGFFIAAAVVAVLIVSVSWWSLLWASVIVGFIVTWALALVDIWRRDDLKTGAAIAWSLGVIIFPVIGTIVYYFARPPASQVHYRGEPVT